MSQDTVRRTRAAPFPGAQCFRDGRVRFRVWAPRRESVAVRIVGVLGRDPVPMADAGEGWFEATLDGVPSGARYMYVLDGRLDRPDPASRALPVGVHGPSEIVDTTAFSWTDGRWRGLPLKDMVLYEIHVGTFTPEGTFEAIIPRLERLQRLGVTTLQLMPVASFPGARNWGYDGVGLFAPQRSYGGAAGLQRLVNTCHARGMAVILDAVYNHVGPEGNYLADFGPYFTDRYRTPWGQAVNYDGADSRGVRDFVIANALFWVREYHVDGLRLDAIHGIVDRGPIHILRELNDAVQRLARRLGRHVAAVAESDLNDRRVIDSVRRGGYGLAGQWCDDFHHAVHTLLTGERRAYYVDFGSAEQLAKAYTHGFVYDGQHSAFRGRRHGTPSRDVAGTRFVVCVQNHDQVGNRGQGERLTALVDFARLKLAAAALLISPYVPLLFMGEEYGEPAPFLFVTDFEDPALQAAVTRGRRDECAVFGGSAVVPDPQDPATFARSKLEWALCEAEPHRRLWVYYRALLRARRRYPVLGAGGKRSLSACVDGKGMLIVLRKGAGGTAAVGLLNFRPEGATAAARVPAGTWRRIADSGEKRFGGPGPTAPSRLDVPRRGTLEIGMAPWGSVVFLRDGPGDLAGRRS